jgi:hypothetical protein
MLFGTWVLESQMNVLPPTVCCTDNREVQTKEREGRNQAAGKPTFLLVQMELFPQMLGLIQHICCHPVYIT